MVEKSKPVPNHPWIAAARERGMSGALGILLDALEPIGPLAAQMLWMAQPLAGLLGARRAAGQLAELLDEPGGIEALRAQLRGTESDEQIS